MSSALKSNGTFNKVQHDTISKLSFLATKVQLNHGLGKKGNLLLTFAQTVDTDKDQYNLYLSFSDVVSIEKTGENFRFIYDVKGRFTVHRIQPEEAKVRSTCIFTDRVRSTEGGYVFTGVCLLTGGGGTQSYSGLVLGGGTQVWSQGGYSGLVPGGYSVQLGGVLSPARGGTQSSRGGGYSG